MAAGLKILGIGTWLTAMPWWQVSGILWAPWMVICEIAGIAMFVEAARLERKRRREKR